MDDLSRGVPGLGMDDSPILEKRLAIEASDFFMNMVFAIQLSTLAFRPLRFRASS